MNYLVKIDVSAHGNYMEVPVKKTVLCKVHIDPAQYTINNEHSNNLGKKFH